jgi:HEPN domain-containing protein
MKTEAYKLFDEAVHKLKAANEELFRPVEDVVTYSVCKNSQAAVINYLKGYLLNNGIDPNNYTTIESLFERCKMINEKFDEIDLTEFGCKGHRLDSTYCNEVSKVRKCFEAADNLDTFLRREKVINF